MTDVQSATHGTTSAPLSATMPSPVPVTNTFKTPGHLWRPQGGPLTVFARPLVSVPHRLAETCAAPSDDPRRPLAGNAIHRFDDAALPRCLSRVPRRRGTAGAAH